MRLKSRYPDVNTIVCKTADPHEFFVTSDGSYVRLIGEAPNWEAVDFEGGPFIQVGTKFENGTIASIKKVNYGFLLKTTD